MKTFKRPMFRRGGSTNEGVMNGIVDRENFRSKGIDDATLEKIQGRRDLFASLTAPRTDSLSNLLISGGLNLISGEGAGDGELAGIARAFKKPTQQFFKEDAAEKQFGRQLGLAAATGILGQKDKMELARMKSRFGKPTNYQSMLNNELVSRFGPKDNYSQQEIKEANKAVQEFMKQGTTNYADDLSKTIKSFDDTPNPSYAAEAKLKHKGNITILTDAFYDLKKGTLDEEKFKQIAKPGVIYFDSGSLKYLKVVKDPNTNVIQIVEVQEPATE